MLHAKDWQGAGGLEWKVSLESFLVGSVGEVYVKVDVLARNGGGRSIGFELP